MKNNKVKLSQLKVTSFVTTMSIELQNTVKAGRFPVDSIDPGDSDACGTQNPIQCPSLIDGCPSAMCTM